MPAKKGTKRKPENRRLNVDLSAKENVTLESIQGMTGESAVGVIRHGLLLLDYYIKNDGRMFVEDPTGEKKTHILLPLTIQSQ